MLPPSSAEYPFSTVKPEMVAVTPELTGNTWAALAVLAEPV
jgi:hypothetical protein